MCPTEPGPTEPFDGGVWGLTVIDGEHGLFRVQEDPLVFRPVDPLGVFGFVVFAGEHVYYSDSSDRVHLLTDGPDPVAATAACVIEQGFGFDAEDHFYTVCTGDVLRDGVAHGTTHGRIAGVTPAGRIVLALETGFALLETDGEERSRTSFDGWEGSFEVEDEVAVVVGERAWVVVRRRFHGFHREIVVMRVQADTGEWTLARRVEAPEFLSSAVPLPDGRVMVSHREGGTGRWEILDIDGSRRFASSRYGTRGFAGP